LKVLSEKGFILDNDLFWVLDKKAAHTEAAWAKRMPKALKIIFGE